MSRNTPRVHKPRDPSRVRVPGGFEVFEGFENPETRTPTPRVGEEARTEVDGGIVRVNYT